jgi:hypothetical protein
VAVILGAVAFGYGRTVGTMRVCARAHAAMLTPLPTRALSTYAKGRENATFRQAESASVLADARCPTSIRATPKGFAPSQTSHFGRLAPEKRESFGGTIPLSRPSDGLRGGAQGVLEAASAPGAASRMRLA